MTMMIMIIIVLLPSLPPLAQPMIALPPGALLGAAASNAVSPATCAVSAEIEARPGSPRDFRPRPLWQTPLNVDWSADHASSEHVWTGHRAHPVHIIRKRLRYEKHQGYTKLRPIIQEDEASQIAMKGLAAACTSTRTWADDSGAVRLSQDARTRRAGGAATMAGAPAAIRCSLLLITLYPRSASQARKLWLSCEDNRPASPC